MLGTLQLCSTRNAMIQEEKDIYVSSHVWSERCREPTTFIPQLSLHIHFLRQEAITFSEKPTIRTPQQLKGQKISPCRALKEQDHGSEKLGWICVHGFVRRREQSPKAFRGHSLIQDFGQVHEGQQLLSDKACFNDKSTHQKQAHLIRKKKTEERNKILDRKRIIMTMM